MSEHQTKAESGNGGVRVDAPVRRGLPFLGLLSCQKTEAIMRGERVEITAEESGMFRAQMDLMHAQRWDCARQILEEVAEQDRMCLCGKCLPCRAYAAIK
jgi:hypothetical protein